MKQEGGFGALVLLIALQRLCASAHILRVVNYSQLLPPLMQLLTATAQVDAGFHAHRAGATWGCSAAAAEHAAALALYSVTICVVDTSDAVAAALSQPPSRASGGWAQALQRAVAIVRVVSAVSDLGVTLEFFHSGVLQSAVRREEDVVALFQRAAAIMKSVAGGADRARFQGVFGLENFKAGTPRDQIKYVRSSFLHYIFVTV